MLKKFRTIIMVFIDLVLINSALYLAVMARFNWQLGAGEKSAYLFLIPWVSIIRLALFYKFGLHQWAFRYASIHEAVNIFKATTIGTLLVILVTFLKQYGYLGHSLAIGRAIAIIDYFICFFLISGSRFLPRLLVKVKEEKRYKSLKRVLIIGAGSAGEIVARELTGSKRIYQLAGFIDDDPFKKNLVIHGIKILGTREDIAKVVEQHRIEEIIIAIPSAPGKVIRDIISHCQRIEAKFKIIPGLHKILAGEVDIKHIREVGPDDLLGRETVRINTAEIKPFLQGKTVLITGAGGTIGAELCRQIAKFNPRRLILYEHNENDTYFLEIELKTKYPSLEFKTIIGDIKDIGLLKHVFSKYRPGVMFHSAAHKHVPLMENNPASAVKNNVIGTRNLVYAAEHYGVESFVLISTDKAVNPTSVMGASKRIAEMLLQAKSKNSRTKFMAVRFGNVIGSSGSVVPVFKRQIEGRGPVTVTHPEVRRFFMTIEEAAQLVIQAGAIGKGGEIFILDMGEQIKIVDLAKNLITLSGLELDKDISIKFIGLRPGEKLYEEPLHNAERDTATKHNKIYITQPDDFDPKILRRDIKRLERLANIMAEDEIIKKMKEIVPTFRNDQQNF
ncbi:MAG: nucleoside-diphosphate sugar epimerase/dehydratase [Candidatus Omnitrophota bacterium]|nr:nucleoside-diphosphate sugar epimerase/dehydratase [Candidatus Omnitrophota bacterium]